MSSSQHTHTHTQANIVITSHRLIAYILPSFLCWPCKLRMEMITVMREKIILNLAIRIHYEYRMKAIRPDSIRDAIMIAIVDWIKLPLCVSLCVCVCLCVENARA